MRSMFALGLAMMFYPVIFFASSGGGLHFVSR